MTLMTEEAIRSQLVLSLSLQPSPDWLQACVAHLQGKNQAVTVDSVLYQVLHSDLRTVVRGTSDDDDGLIHRSTGGSFQSAAALSGISSRSSINPPQSFPAAVQLRQAIYKSSQEAHSWKQTLPESFGLMCQMEELLDVTVNAERRLEAGPVCGNNPNPLGNQHSRCLKLCLTDGHYNRSDGGIISSNQNKHRRGSFIVGTEVTPIPNLSAQSLSGLKVLLKGPLEIRHQILLLHPGNIIVLGGCVEELVDHQRRALKKAKLAAGVGVDPTIRALIGTGPDPLQDQEGDDEADEASGDIVTPRQPPHQQQQQQQQQPWRPQAFVTGVGGVSNSSRSAIVTQSASITQLSMPPPPPTNGIPSSSLGGVAWSALPWAAPSVPRILPDATRQSTGADQRRPPSTSGGASEHQHTPQGPLFRPAVNINGSGSSHASSSSLPSTVFNTSTISRINIAAVSTPENAQAANPYLRGSSSTTSSVNTTAVVLPRMTGPIVISTVAPPIDIDRGLSGSSGIPRPTANPYSSAPTEGTVSPLPAQSRHSMTPASTELPSAGLQSSTTPKGISSSCFEHASPPLVQNMTFSSLRQLLLQLVSSREMYESYNQRNIVFRVRLCKKIGPNSNFFDVVKIKSKNGKKGKRKDGAAEKKYDYFISAAFLDPHKASDPDDSISIDSLSCQLHPALLDPHFEVSAAELRSISRTDRGECGRITDEGGNQVREAYFSARYWQATLHLSPDEVFGADETHDTDVRMGTSRDGALKEKSPKERLVDLKAPILLLQRPEAC